MDAFIQVIQGFWVNLQTGVLPHLGFWSYIFLAILVAVEGPIVTLLGAASASGGYLRLPLVFLSACIGNLASDVGWYYLGYFGKIEWVLNSSHHFGIKRSQIEKLEEGLRTHARKIMFVAKLTNGLSMPTIIAAGLVRVPLRRWLPTQIIAETIWTGSLALIGFYATEGIRQVEKGVQYVGYVGTAILALMFILLVQRAIKHNRIFAGSVIINNDEDDEEGKEKETKQG